MCVIRPLLRQIGFQKMPEKTIHFMFGGQNGASKKGSQDGLRNGFLVSQLKVGRVIGRKDFIQAAL